MLKIIIYEESIKITATGSSVFYIDSKFKDSLAGRKRIFLLKHLNFSEFLRFKGAENLISELNELRKSTHYISALYKDIEHYFNDYLIYGGYPAVSIEKENSEKELILNELQNAYIKRDIHDAGIKNEVAFYKLIQLLSYQTGNLLNINEFSKILRIDNKTIEKYIDVLQKSFHIQTITPFFRNYKKEIIKMPKLFFYDNGLRNSFLNNFNIIETGADRGQLLENYVYIRLSEMYKNNKGI